MTRPFVQAVHCSGPDDARIDIWLPAEHPAFAGHFPGTPILPGVVQVDWAVTLADDYLGTGCRSATDFQVKFHRTIGPESVVELILRLDRGRGSLSFEFRHDDATASSGRVSLERPA